LNPQPPATTTTTTATTHPYRPFLDPLPVASYWFALLIPIAILVSVTYKAVRSPSLNRFWPGVLFLSTKIILGVLALAAALYAFAEIYVTFFRRV
jgi:hypothetical protein